MGKISQNCCILSDTLIHHRQSKNCRKIVDSRIELSEFGKVTLVRPKQHPYQAKKKMEVILIAYFHISFINSITSAMKDLELMHNYYIVVVKSLITI